MRDASDFKSLIAVLATLALGLTARHRTRSHRNQTRPRITPLKVIHPDELQAEFQAARAALARRKAG